jgi:hypothetical protein
MTDFESRLSAALRDEAEELSMDVDLNKAANQLDVRLDETEKSRRRWSVVVAVAATVAVVVGVGVLLGVLRSRDADSAPVNPPPSPSASASVTATSFSSSGFVHRFTWTPPLWAAANPTGVDTGSSNRVVWEQSGCVPATPCDYPIDYKIRVIASVGYWSTPTATAQTRATTYAAYLAQIQAQRKYGLTIADEKTTTVGGRPATLMTLTAAPGSNLVSVLGCERPNDTREMCWGLEPVFTIRFAVVDTVGGVTTMWLRATSTNPDKDRAFADFESALQTLTWTS